MIGVWTISFTLSMIATALNFSIVRRQLKSKKLDRLNKNLKPLGLYWSNDAGDFQALSAGSIEEDARRAQRGALMVGFLGFASLPGFILLSIVILSLRVLARSRREKAVFQSPLAIDDQLDIERTQSLVEEMREIR